MELFSRSNDQRVGKVTGHRIDQAAGECDLANDEAAFTIRFFRSGKRRFPVAAPATLPGAENGLPSGIGEKEIFQ